MEWHFWKTFEKEVDETNMEIQKQFHKIKHCTTEIKGYKEYNHKKQFFKYKNHAKRV